MSQGSIIPPTAKYWIGFQQTKRIGPVRLQRLLEHFTTIDAAWHAPVADLRSVLDETSLDRFVAVRREFDGDAEIERIDRLGISISTLDSATYPALLREIPNPPSVLYYKGTLVAEDARSVGIVGSRNCTPYGRQMAQTISRDLAAAEITVIGENGSHVAANVIANDPVNDIALLMIAEPAHGTSPIRFSPHATPKRPQPAPSSHAEISNSPKMSVR
ncbi:MAG TPA: DNA-processing protein DprA [Thermomicrobiales bacterium]|nr:DNA-processing protein DprA [Thermomicrobiales bacterium]